MIFLRLAVIDLGVATLSNELFDVIGIVGDAFYFVLF
jgi:hypothetical protein